MKYEQLKYEQSNYEQSNYERANDEQSNDEQSNDEQSNDEQSNDDPAFFILFTVKMENEKSGTKYKLIMKNVNDLFLSTVITSVEELALCL